MLKHTTTYVVGIIASHTIVAEAPSAAAAQWITKLLELPTDTPIKIHTRRDWDNGYDIYANQRNKSTQKIKSHGESLIAGLVGLRRMSANYGDDQLELISIAKNAMQTFIETL